MRIVVDEKELANVFRDCQPRSHLSHVHAVYKYILSLCNIDINLLSDVGDHHCSHHLRNLLRIFAERYEHDHRLATEPGTIWLTAEMRASWELRGGEVEVDEATIVYKETGK